MHGECRQKRVCFINHTNYLYGFVCQAKDPCSPNPCHHDGQCLISGENDFECDCAKGYTGLKCERKLVSRLLKNSTRKVTPFFHTRVVCGATQA